MKLEIYSVFCVLVVLTGSSQERGLSSAVPPVFTSAALQSHAGASASPDLTEDPGKEFPQLTHNPAGRDETSTATTPVTQTAGTVRSLALTRAALKTHLLITSSAASQLSNVPVVVTAPLGTPSPSAGAHSLLSTPSAPSTTPLQHVSATAGRTLLTADYLASFSSQSAHTVQDASSTGPASTTQLKSLATTTTQTTGHPEASAPGGPTHQDVPSELNVGDEDLKTSLHRPSSPLDPLLAGLLSVFIVTTGIVFFILFLKFRQRTNHPEFHRLQDVPMDDLMEDTPLSRHSY